MGCDKIRREVWLIDGEGFVGAAGGEGVGVLQGCFKPNQYRILAGCGKLECEVPLWSAKILIAPHTDNTGEISELTGRV